MKKTEMEKIYYKYKDIVFRAAFSYCKNQTMSEDITSDVFYRYFICKNPPDNDEHTKAWLIRTSINCCKDVFKSFRYKNVVALDETQLVYNTPQESEVYEAVMSLSPKYRIIIHLYYYEGYTSIEISEIINKSPATVRSRLSRARQMLKNSLGKEFHI